MCLVSRQKEPLIATKDIECYKVVRLTINSNLWSGLYWGGKFEFEKKIFAKDKPNVWLSNTGNVVVEEGFFHALLELADAMSLYHEERDSGFNSNIKVCKCIIPRGSKYYKSLDDIEICSPSMIVYKKLDSYDKSMRTKYSAIIIYFKTLFNKLLNIFK